MSAVAADADKKAHGLDILRTATPNFIVLVTTDCFSSLERGATASVRLTMHNPMSAAEAWPCKPLNGLSTAHHASAHPAFITSTRPAAVQGVTRARHHRVGPADRPSAEGTDLRTDLTGCNRGVGVYIARTEQGKSKSAYSSNPLAAKHRYQTLQHRLGILSLSLA